MATKFSDRIKKLRKSFSLSQKEAAEKLGVSQAQLSHYENGIRECSLDFVVALSKLYGVSCDYLLGASSDKLSSKNIHTQALALDAVLCAADKMQDKASGEALTMAADCCVFALADAVSGDNSPYDKRASRCSLGAAEVFLASITEESETADQNLAKIARNAESHIKTIGK